MLSLNRLPRFNHPLFNSERFKKVTDDGFFISFQAKNNEEAGRMRAFLDSIGGRNSEIVKDE
jgi:hypothetical protein